MLAKKNESPYLRGFHAFYFSPSGLNGAERTYAQAKRGVRSEALKVTHIRRKSAAYKWLITPENTGVNGVS